MAEKEAFMKKIVVLFSLVAVQLVIGRFVWADPFLMQGARAIGMGGAFVSIAEDSSSSWNPAGFAKQKGGIDVELPVAMKAMGTGDIVKKLDNVYRLNFDRINKSRTETSTVLFPEIASDFFRMLDGLDELNKKGVGILADFNAGVKLRVKDIGFSVNGYVMTSGDPYFDMNNINMGNPTGSSTTDAQDAIFALVGTGSKCYDPGSWQETTANNLVKLVIYITGKENIITNEQAESLIQIAEQQALLNKEDVKKFTELIVKSAAYLGINTVGSETPMETTTVNSFKNNKSALVTKGCMINEFVLTFAKQDDKLKNLSLGVNLKYMQGKMAYNFQKIFEENVDKQVGNDIFDKSTKLSSNFGIDIGALYDLSKKTTLGLVVRNINSPSFAYPEGSNLPDYKIKPQVRAGVSYKPFNWMLLAIDSDLTKNKTILDGFDSKIFSAGTEINIFNHPAFNIALRAGIMENSAEDDVGQIFTCGLGINLLHLHADVTGLISNKKTKTKDGDEIPTAAGASAQLSLNF